MPYNINEHKKIKIVSGENSIKINKDGIAKGKGNPNQCKKSILKPGDTDVTLPNGTRLAIVEIDATGDLVGPTPHPATDITTWDIILDDENDGLIIETESSPGCTWYFFGGVWYRVCE